MNNGATNVAGLYTVPNGSGTQFTDGAQRIYELGLRTMKFFSTPEYAIKYPFQTSFGGTPTNTTELLQTTPYDTVLRMGFTRIFISVFTFANGSTNWWRASTAVDKFIAEYNELKTAAKYLMVALAGTGIEIVFQNWEGDWAFMDKTVADTFVDYRDVQGYIAFLNIRQKAIADARREVASDVKVLMGLECNRVVDAYLYRNRRRIVTDIAGNITPDLILYSGYDSTIDTSLVWGPDFATWYNFTMPLFDRALKRIKKAFPKSPVVLSEFGYPENEAPVGRDIQAMLQATHDVALANALHSFLFWQAFDNEHQQAPNESLLRGFFLYKPDGALSASGLKFQQLGPYS